MAEINLQDPPGMMRNLLGAQLKMQSLTAEDIQDWLVAQISGQLNVYPDEIDPQAPFSRYGLSSLQAMEIATLGNEQLGLALSPLTLWNFPNVESLAQFLAEELARSDIERFEI
jgi:acyl carrier protein